MTNPDDPVYSDDRDNPEYREDYKVWPQLIGLSKRELFAAMTLQGALASFYKYADYDGLLKVIPEYSVKVADALIVELNKERQ